jgi:FAD/FMN-containing dehydrogenase
MNRRELIKSVAANLALQPVIWTSLTARAAVSGPAKRVRPADPEWPGASAWEALREKVGGNLIGVQAPFATCHDDPDGVACQEARRNVTNPFWLGDQPGGTEVSGWLDAWMPAPSVYAIKAQSAADIAAGVDFARVNHLRLVIKGTGHSYLGTSNAPDSLLIWTRFMNKVTLHDAFVPEGCAGRLSPVSAVSAGAGALWIDLYDAVTTKAGRYVQGGGCTDTGVAGLVQGGGFGSFSKGFGTAAAGLLEAEIVTADGAVRIVNECRDPDLFWAIKGGGGGTFGVVTRLTLRTHELPRFFGWASGKIKANSDAAYARLIARFVAFYRDALFNPHWGEQVHFDSDNVLDISMASQGLDHDQASAVWRPFFDWAKASPSDYSILSELRAGAAHSRHWWKIGKDSSMIPDRRQGAPTHHGWWRDDQGEVGAFVHGYESLWLPASLLQEDRASSLVEALIAASRYKKVDLHINKGLAGAPAEAILATRKTATNPAVLEAFTLVIIADGEQPPRYPDFARSEFDEAAARRNARAIDSATAELRKIAPNSGCYVSESNYFNNDWQQEYWGVNYRKLKAIKEKYDPDGLFVVHHGVGSENWSADGFTRLA